MKIKRLVVALAAVLLGLVGLAAAGLLVYGKSSLDATPPGVEFSIASGSSLTAAAHQMAQAGVLRHPAAFVLLARVLGESGNVRAGIYELERALTPYELLYRITRGDYMQEEITFPEGWTFREMRAALDAHPALRHDTAGLSEAQILERLAISAPSAEGWFFPDTYYFARGASDLRVLERAHRLMRRQLAALWESRAPDLPLATPYEALILASIVEKESARAEDRPLIAAVFANRLRRGMRLQADPTVIYGLGEGFEGNLRKGDLLADGPYNTYTRRGLPPTPIAMPGLASLSAALNPARSDVLYFVSRGDGSTHFSASLAEHERAVTKYQRSGRR